MLDLFRRLEKEPDAFRGNSAIPHISIYLINFLDLIKRLCGWRRWRLRRRWQWRRRIWRRWGGGAWQWGRWKPHRRSHSAAARALANSESYDLSGNNTKPLLFRVILALWHTFYFFCIAFIFRLAIGRSPKTCAKSLNAGSSLLTKKK